jgi:hypothetical protein
MNAATAGAHELHELEVDAASSDTAEFHAIKLKPSQTNWRQRTIEESDPVRGVSQPERQRG